MYMNQKRIEMAFNPLFVLSRLLPAFLLITFSACSNPTEERDYGRWDEDQNANLDDTEFGNAWTKSQYFTRWDSNGDGYLDESEWHTARNENLRGYEGSFQDWDTDGDNRLSEQELRQGMYTHYDRDGDGMISEEEYNEWYTPNTTVD
jgi:hypothetical protein